MINQHRHVVDFVAHKMVKESVEVTFVTNKGEIVDFPAHKKVKEPVEVRFLAKD
jgi:hypothetical protein